MYTNRHRLLSIFSSYYGDLLCVCWSPDGKYVLTGGQDDLVSIWSVADSMLVARCPGHQSWVTAVAFDPWRCDERNYRFGSVGEDCRLLLWDFSVGMLHRRKAVGVVLIPPLIVFSLPHKASIRHRGSVSSRYLNPLQRADTHNTSISRLRSNSSDSEGPQDAGIEHPVQSKAATATLPPILVNFPIRIPVASSYHADPPTVEKCRCRSALLA